MRKLGEASQRLMKADEEREARRWSKCSIDNNDNNDIDNDDNNDNDNVNDNNDNNSIAIVI